MSPGGDNELGSSSNQLRQGGGGGAALNLIDASLRISAVPLSVVCIWLTVTNHQNNETYGKLNFTNLLGLK